MPSIELIRDVVLVVVAFCGLLTWKQTRKYELIEKILYSLYRFEREFGRHMGYIKTYLGLCVSNVDTSWALGDTKSLDSAFDTLQVEAQLLRSLYAVHISLDKLRLYQYRCWYNNSLLYTNNLENIELPKYEEVIAENTECKGQYCLCY